MNAHGPDPSGGHEDHLARLSQRLRQAFIEGEEKVARRLFGRELTAEELGSIVSRASEIDAAVNARDFPAALTLAGRNEGPNLLFEWRVTKKIGKPEIAALLPGVWSAAEWPERCLPRASWIGLFRIADYPRPAEALRIYRGAPPRYARGMAWTTDVEQARRFAEMRERPNKPTYVYTAVAQPDAVLADIDALSEGRGRDEHEIVVDPSRLGKIKRLR